MNVELRLTTAETSQVIKNLYPMYLHDLSAFLQEPPNAYGIFETDEIRTWDEWSAKYLEIWWKKPAVLFPFLILADGRPAGFCLIASPPHVPKGIDYLVNEFFLLHPYRGKGFGEAALAQVFGRFRGNWRLDVLGKNDRALSFWRRVVGAYTGGQFEEGDCAVGRMLTFRT